MNMAAAPKPAGDAILRLPVDQIDIPADRLRALKPEQAAAIGEAIKADRQYDAISVARLPGKSRYVLVDGLHRLEGCRAVGLTEIDVRLVSADRDSRRRQEVLSAWARADHDAFDKAAQVAAMVDLSTGGPLGAQPDDEESASLMMRLGAGWQETTCEALGISRANLFRYLKLHRFYDDGQKAALRERGVAGELVPLIRLAALPPEDFALAFAAVGRGCTIAEAFAFIAPAPVNGWDKQKAKVLNAAAKWQPHELRELIDELRALYRAATDGKAAG
jgi:hypothetical protein